jgi:hypothetical protein
MFPRRPIRYNDVPVAAWSDKLREMRVPKHLVRHLSTMGELHAQGRYDRLTDDLLRLTGRTPTSMREFVERHVAEFTRA